jgi:hypothetical protein
MSGGGGESQKTSSGPPDWAVPYFQTFMQRGQQVADMPYQAYGGQTVAQLNPYQTAGLDATAARAMQGSPVNDAASSELQKTLSGGYLNNNPYMDSLVNQAQGDVIRNYQTAIAPQIDALDARSGSFGNSGVQQVLGESRYQLGDTLGKISTNLRGGDYAAERNRMQGAVGMAPTIANQDYVDANALLQAGGAYQGQEQRNLADAYSRFTEARDYPRQQLATLGSTLGANIGQQVTSPGQAGNPLAGGMGGALAGAQLGSIFPGIGTGIGAIGGGVLGALGGK